MSAKLKELLSKDIMISRNIGEDAVVLSDEDRLNEIRNEISLSIPRNKMSAQLKELLSEDIIVSRNTDEESTILSREDRLDKIRQVFSFM